MCILSYTILKWINNSVHIYTITARIQTHLVGFTLAHAGAHGVHPQVRVQLVRTHTCMRVHHFGHGHGHRSHTVRVKEQSAAVSQQKPDPSRKQHPPHVGRRTAVKFPQERAIGVGETGPNFPQTSGIRRCV